MRFQKARLIHAEIPLLKIFKTSYGELKTKDFYIIELMNDAGICGYGELEAFPLPDYTEETLETAILIVKQHLLPNLVQKDFAAPEEVHQIFSWVQGNEMAKAAVELAVWDVFAKAEKKSLAKMIGATKKSIAVGVSIGIQDSVDSLVQLVEEYQNEGYERVKIKIEPNKDIAFIKAVREKFPKLSLMADANSAYNREDFTLLKELDQFGLEMIEQPFGVKDFVNHAWLQRQLNTRICLDENIRSLEDVQQAHLLGSCQAINLKLARVGGMVEALKITRYCAENDIIVWCGGMLEAGIGRAHNVALAARAEFNFPGDISASNRYFHEDIIFPEFTLEQGRLNVPDGYGIGVGLNHNVLQKYTKTTEEILLNKGRS
ncbi:o-succinylbenzoate synthase [Listeria sp. FSL L7-1485]|uniref:o-succinylbenzoate synthase n=1 Tax=Listeria immobilis TaxID=2713502 RepID=A0A7X0X6T8_9LIST|nr:o-succinylbenzoate synthase [Listeria immobilis]MBC1482621.1 o-succinylbenzoate synthase [Listeria immobilis]MBC1488291.1 o-succinylbenzoate synthase [Listeria immobilis]MBC1507205.1 o-succinylbenzoate synthase [Listeria immobilis]MBC1509883.1 o-succinylbenzoate synthase [Listeria immobilis]MBC1516342.1 o-succinylbenzoate synthase [Listeria immobilis]